MRIAKDDAKTRKGTKTAWMGTRWVNGRQEVITDETITILATAAGGEEREVPWVREYKHLGTPLMALHEGRHEAAREKVRNACKRTIWAIGKVPCLTQKQLRRAMQAAVTGVIGYYGRATPIRYEDCAAIEEARAAVLRHRKWHTGDPSNIYAGKEAGGMAHEHAYQIAVAAYVDQIDAVMACGEGEPAREAMNARIAQVCDGLGCDVTPQEWRVHEQHQGLHEDGLVEAWLLMRARTGLAGCRTGWRPMCTEPDSDECEHDTRWPRLRADMTTAEWRTARRQRGHWRMARDRRVARLNMELVHANQAAAAGTAAAMVGMELEMWFEKLAAWHAGTVVETRQRARGGGWQHRVVFEVAEDEAWYELHQERWRMWQDTQCTT